MHKISGEITRDSSVTDIVTNNYRTAEVFRKYDIDFCCGGKMSLNTACDLKGMDASELFEELQNVNSVYQNADKWPPDFLIDYLLTIHHSYFKNNIPVVQEYISRFIAAHAKKYPDVQQLPVITEQLYKKLNDLVRYESESLFPYIKRIFFAFNNNELYGRLFIKTLRKLSTEEFGKYNDQIKMLESQIVHLANNFILPENACSTHKVMLQKLREFINFIKQHLLIENKILIPATLEMEKNLLEKYIQM